MRQRILAIMALTLLVLAGGWAADINEMLWEAARKGDVPAVRVALAKGADVNSKTEYGVTGLHFAADKGHAKVVKLLLENGAKVNTRDSFYGVTALSMSASRGHAAVVKALLEKGAIGAEAALGSAIRSGYADVVKVILATAKIDTKNLSAPLMAAKDRGHGEIVEALEKAGAKELKGIDIPLETLRRYAGDYKGPSQNELALFLKDGALRVGSPPRAWFTLYGTDKAKFKAVENSQITVKIHEEDDKVTGFTLTRGLSSTTFSRFEKKPKPITPVRKKPVLEPVQLVTEPKNWPSFRGPGAAGLADGQYPPTGWDAETGQNIRWKTPIPGLGHSSPVVWDDRVFVTTAVSDNPNPLFKPGLYGDVDPVADETTNSYRLFCLDKNSGRIVWEQLATEALPQVKRHPKSSHANPSPATDGKHVVAFFGSEGLYCYDIHGKLVWKKDVGRLDSGWFYDPEYQWGFGSSPIIYRDMVIVQCDIQKDSFIAAYELKTGIERWRTPRNEIPSWGTPTVYENEHRAVLITNGTKFARGYDPMTGEELWRLGPNSEITVPTPFVAHDLIFVISGYRPMRPIYAIKVGERGDLTLKEDQTSSDAVAWSNPNGGSYMTTAIVYGEHLYVCSNSGILTCYEAKSGERVYRKRLPGGGGFTASPVAADGRIYFTSEDGDVFVVKPGPEYELICKNSLGEYCMATPAISDGMIFIRGRRHLFGIGHKPTADAPKANR